MLAAEVLAGRPFRVAGTRPTTPQFTRRYLADLIQTTELGSLLGQTPATSLVA